jgi:hypothetical protein
MSEFKRYEPDYEDSTMQFAVGDVFVMSPCDNGDWCLYDDVAPIIQRNKELEAELARRSPLYAEPKPAQIPDEIVEFIHTFPELNMSNYSDDDVAELNVWGIELVQMVKGKS